MEESLERYVMFLREIGRHPNHYKKIVIRTYAIDKDTGRIKECDDGYILYAEMMLDVYCDNGGHE